jgi:hypothetical protein
MKHLTADEQKIMDKALHASSKLVAVGVPVEEYEALWAVAEAARELLENEDSWTREKKLRDALARLAER